MLLEGEPYHTGKGEGKRGAAQIKRARQLVSIFSENEGKCLSPGYSEAQASLDFIDKLWIAPGWDVNHETGRFEYFVLAQNCAPLIFSEQLNQDTTPKINIWQTAESCGKIRKIWQRGFYK
jgi:hypothetical protein